MIRVLIFIMMCLVDGLFAQSPYKACVQKVRDFSRKADATLPKNGAVLYTNYTQQVVMWDSVNTPTITMDVKMMMNKDHLYYITPDIEVYQDTRDVFMIVHSKKKVLWGQSDAEEVTGANKRIGKVAALKDTLFDLSTPVKCETYKTKDGKEMTRLVLKTNQAGRDMFNIDMIEYLYNNVTGSIDRVTTNFTPSYEIKRMVVTYKINDFNYKGAKLDKQVSSKIVNDRNLLTAKYKGYQLVDNR